MRTDYKLNKFSHKVNEHGFRYGGAKNVKTSYKIMCVGGSTTFNDAATDSLSTYPAQLEKFLQKEGYDITVINAGVSYHTSLDVLMRFITLGSFSDIDMLLIHTGGNDTGPLNSPFAYRPDYTHWRDIANYNPDKVFKHLWYDFPFSTFRLFLILYFDPGNVYMTSHQTTRIFDEMISDTKITRSRTKGLENYFSSIISICKGKEIVPVTILFNRDYSRDITWGNEYWSIDQQKIAHKKDSISTSLHNAIMDSISRQNDIKVIEFNKFIPSSENFWSDVVHLNNDGLREKAKFIGEFLVSNFDLPKKIKVTY